MNRASFLARTAAFVGLAVAPKALAELEPAEVLPAVPEWRTLPPSLDRLIASGGLCAPVTPYYAYDLPVSELPRFLPSFTASRGGIRYDVPPA